MKRVFALLLVLLASFAVSAEPKPQGSMGCTNGYVRYSHTVADVTTVATIGPAFLLAGAPGAHTETTTGTNISNCFTNGTLGHVVQYTCANAFYKITALINGKVSTASNLSLMFGASGIENMTVSHKIAETSIVQTAENINDYKQHVLEHDITLVQNQWYGIQTQTTVTGTTHTNAASGWWQFEEMRCQLGTP